MSIRVDGLRFPAYKNNDERNLRSAIRTVKLNRHLVQDVWRTPSFQREITVTQKLRKIGDEFKNSGQIPSLLVVAKWDDSGLLYKVDGNQRSAAFLIQESDPDGQKELLVQVDFREFDNEAAASKYYETMQTSICRSTPDHRLQSLEPRCPNLLHFREGCKDIVTYGRVIKGRGRVLPVSHALRCWASSNEDPPAKNVTNTEILAQGLTALDVQQLSGLLHSLIRVWGDQREYKCLWGPLNLTLCMWLYRRMVIGVPAPAPNVTRLTSGQFEAGVAGLTHSSYRSALGNKKLRKEGEADEREYIYGQLGNFFMQGLRSCRGFQNKVIRCPVPTEWRTPRGWKR